MSVETKELEPQLGQLAQEVHEAETALLETLRESPDRDWNPRELQDEATNGWSAAVVSIAFWRLVSSEQLGVDEKFRVRLLTGDAA